MRIPSAAIARLMTAWSPSAATSPCSNGFMLKSPTTAVREIPTRASASSINRDTRGTASAWSLSRWCSLLLRCTATRRKSIPLGGATWRMETRGSPPTGHTSPCGRRISSLIRPSGSSSRKNRCERPALMPLNRSAPSIAHSASTRMSGECSSTRAVRRSSRSRDLRFQNRIRTGSRRRRCGRTLDGAYDNETQLDDARDAASDAPALRYPSAVSSHTSAAPSSW